MVKIFKALSDDNRLKIFKLVQQEQSICACKLLSKLEISQSTLSHHMQVLVDAKLLDVKKDGKWSIYSVNHVTLDKVSKFFE